MKRLLVGLLLVLATPVFAEEATYDDDAYIRSMIERVAGGNSEMVVFKGAGSALARFDSVELGSERIYLIGIERFDVFPEKGAKMFLRVIDGKPAKIWWRVVPEPEPNIESPLFVKEISLVDEETPVPVKS